MAELSLADLIDLELALQRDRSRPIEELRTRDTRIGREIGADGLEDRALFRAWLAALRRDGLATGGLRIVSFLDTLGVALFVLGLLLGAGSVAGWLEMAAGQPVNVVNLWWALIGSQLVLLLGWGVALWRGALRGPGAWLPALAARILTRLGHRDALASLGELRKLDWLYARLRFWRTAALGQTFALAFNLAALGALVVIPYVDDPAFGWRSRLLEPETLQASAAAIALPWRHWAPAPGIEAVRRTRTSSVDPRFTAPADGPETDAVWAVWWPFLVGSLAVYGLLPRLLLWVLAQLGVRQQLARAALDHADFARLAERLRRPDVDTRAPDADTRADGSDAVAPAVDRSQPLGDGRALVLRWEGVSLDDDRISRLLRDGFRTEATGILTVGGLDPALDRSALEQTRSLAPGAALVVVVQAWEPPVADHADFFARLRAELGDGRPLVVLLHEVDGASAGAARQRAVWRRRLAGAGDPWLRVDRLMQAEAG